MKSPAAPTFPAKQEVTAAIDLLNWLTNHSIELPSHEQP